MVLLVNVSRTAAHKKFSLLQLLVLLMCPPGTVDLYGSTPFGGREDIITLIAECRKDISREPTSILFLKKCNES